MPRGIQTNVGGPTGSYFGTKTYKQKLDLADDYRKKKKKKKTDEDEEE
jgi:hypothetical protein